MIEIELDGKKVSVPEGSMVMHAADAAGIYIPHFCYHKKLTIAANCRMCLVDIEKAPKPMPACATPVTQGMIVRTKSDKAIKAQQSVMEFLLINHPLDCPICDQGGECQLQDLAVGYGGSASRYAEEKRVVFHKDVGPLISMEEMSRCIHCTRCVRFGQEVAGVMELGMIHRGEHCRDHHRRSATPIDSELSGNMIDICPVGALTSKPFRYSARTWELSRRKSVSPHDSTGANLIVQVKANKVMRVVPLENEDVNECWIADRDRFSYEALNSDERLTQPMLKQGGAMEDGRLEHRAGLRGRRPEADQGASTARSAIGALGSAHAHASKNCTCWPSWCAAWAARTSTTALRHADFANRAGRRPCALARHARSRRCRPCSARFVVGSFLRKDHPLFAQRIRQAARKGAQVHSLHAVHDDWAMPLAHAVHRGAERLGRRRWPTWPPPSRSQGRCGAGCAATPERRGAGHCHLAAAVASARPCCWATPPRSTRRRRSCWRWRNWIGAADRRHGRLPRRSGQQRRRATGRRAAGRRAG